MSPSPLARILTDAIERTLDYRVAIAFSGGLDSATLAAVAKEKVETHLITISAGESPDLLAAREAAAALGLPLQEVVLDEKTIENTAQHCQRLMDGTLTDLELMAGLWHVAEAAKEAGFKTLLTGSGAEETFIGYNKYYEAHDRGLDLQAVLDEEIRTLPSRDLMRAQMVCRHWEVEVRTPFLDEELLKAVRAVPISERIGTREMKKPLLRKLAAELGVPDCARLRPKKAMQYGSGMHKVMEKMHKEGRLKTEPNRVPEWLKEKRE
ncbi:Asparagine synthase [uncultured archaeon]|nr:Asparagine synthase [uncultured archaeon]